MEKSDKNQDNQTVNNYYFNTPRQPEKRRREPKIITPKSDLDSFMESNIGLSEFFTQGIEENFELPPDEEEKVSVNRFLNINYIVISVILFLLLTVIIYNIFFISSYNSKIEKINILIDKKQINLDTKNEELEQIILTNLDQEYQDKGYIKLSDYYVFNTNGISKYKINKHKANLFDILQGIVYDFMTG